MPTYQYRCKECGHDFEIVQAFSDNALSTCPECKKKALKKVYGNVGISFKGSGFYKNDNRSSGASSSGKASSSGDSSSADSSSSESTSSSSKDAKSDTKSDTKKSEKASTSSSATD